MKSKVGHLLKVGERLLVLSDFEKAENILARKAIEPIGSLRKKWQSIVKSG